MTDREEWLLDKMQELDDKYEALRKKYNKLHKAAKKYYDIYNPNEKDNKHTMIIYGIRQDLFEALYNEEKH